MAEAWTVEKDGGQYFRYLRSDAGWSEDRAQAIVFPSNIAAIDFMRDNEISLLGATFVHRQVQT